MALFEAVHFRGAFRDYQQRVLDCADRYLKDGKINIVAAPGSGKTVLGLELIRRLNAPCLILSPTTAIREQWGERFRELFLEDSTDFEKLFSNDLHRIRPITSITYQALYSAMERRGTDGEKSENCADVDLPSLLNAFDIRTICLDEAHHLKNEWQKALEAFIDRFGQSVTVVSLTATPPYDSESGEWNRYIRVCGEIDEEIFVPELVAQNTLCPHQDYVYFNYPTAEEAAELTNYRQNAMQALREIAHMDCLRIRCEELNRGTDREKLFSSAGEYLSLLVLFQAFGFEINPRLVKFLTAQKTLPLFSMKHAEVAVQFLLDGDLLTESQKEELHDILKKNGVCERRKAAFLLNTRLKKHLMSSVGKLKSIGQIVKCEHEALGSALRMLILTDYIKKEMLSDVGTDSVFRSVNVVSIFETLRRADDRYSLGVLSGSLVILPSRIELPGLGYRKIPIPNTQYCTVEFGGTNHTAVEAVGRLFELGKINILIGTKALLGEGWDSPCINSLVLASFVGSFVQSNQMRGRAIRVDKSNPEKVANIWHLVTAEPPTLLAETISGKLLAALSRDYTQLYSYDFEVLKRRFDAFMGPNDKTGDIESGIERLTAISPPFDRAGIDRINQTMVTLAKKRSELRKMWKNETAGQLRVAVETPIPMEKRIPVFTFFNAVLWLFLFALQAVLIDVGAAFLATAPPGAVLLFLAVEAVLLVGIYRAVKAVCLHANPARSIAALGRSVFRTLRDCELISGGAGLETVQNKDLDIVSLYLRNASIRDQNVFNNAMAELLSPIENPRYILIGKNALGKRNDCLSFACPSAIGKKKDFVECLAKHLKQNAGDFELFFTVPDGGRRMILKCRRHAYITRTHQILYRKRYKVVYL